MTWFGHPLNEIWRTWLLAAESSEVLNDNEGFLIFLYNILCFPFLLFVWNYMKLCDWDLDTASVCQVVQLCRCPVISAQTRQLLVFCSRSRHPVTLPEGSRKVPDACQKCCCIAEIYITFLFSMHCSIRNPQHPETNDSKRNIGPKSKIHSNIFKSFCLTCLLITNMCIFCNMPALSLSNSNDDFGCSFRSFRKIWGDMVRVKNDRGSVTSLLFLSSVFMGAIAEAHHRIHG